MAQRSSGKGNSLKGAFLLRFGIIIVMVLALIAVVATSIIGVRNTKDLVAELNSEKSTLYSAGIAHYKWANGLNSSINYNAAFKGSTDPATCDFGKFIYSSDVQQNEAFASFLAMAEPIHNEVHTTAVAILPLIQTDLAQAQSIFVNKIEPNVESLVAEINSRITEKNAEIEIAEAELDAVVNRAMIMCFVAVALILIACIETYRYVKKEIIAPLSIMDNECKKLAAGSLSLDFSEAKCTSSEMCSLTGSLTVSIQEIKKYIEAIEFGMSAFASGNFTTECPIKFLGDFAQIEKSIVDFQNTMNQTLFEISSAATQVFSGAEQVSCGAQSLAQGATEQASSVEELSATITNISQQISQNAENAQLADKLGKKSSEVVESSTFEMQQLSSSISEIQSSSESIRNIIKTIDDIAFQTNLLALNAAVEAARAGEAGKGFAVVADEVRNLAQKSAEAAKNTTELIEASLSAVNRGTQLAESTNTAFSQVADNVQDVLNVIEKIAVASKEQADQVSQISIGVDQISAVVQTNSATSQESAAASEELSGQANMMKALLNQFQIKNHVNSANMYSAPSTGADADWGGGKY